MMATCLCFVVSHCWLCKAKIVISLRYIISPMSGVVGGGRDLLCQFTGGGLRAPSPLLYFQTNSSYISFREGWHGSEEKACLPLNPKGMGTGSLKHLFLTFFFSLPPASAPFHPLSIPKLWHKVCILGETPGDVMDVRALFEMETHTFYAAREHREYPSRDGDGKWNKWKKIAYLYWGFPFKNTSKYRNNIFYSGYDALTAVEYPLTNTRVDHFFFSLLSTL